ncbi:uncharacterized protein [Drosophila pseudoobscura]|uniref:Uncharacterized protein isoform X1 n=1 Tax=Drosophila pseudoobscura pseudoobscura TaxID=46245 RepID=A0A6I8W656_DROPS|nr:uncharacterized protein LOC4811869 isoform X1 [Drosophila pseudoobscura]XP_033238783.1 uncharacterized protein LOC4811869 isoform X1 [Drosophila pseudoobscura]XP_033238784.1 uncharacterized protein LOC4811869 isoform X1 [Drosophila pseudoobscura]
MLNLALIVGVAAIAEEIQKEQYRNDDDGKQFEDGGGQLRIRNVLTLEERVAVIRQYDILPMYSKIAKNFNCSWEQIKSIVSNREAIMEFYEASRRHNDLPNEELRRRKLNFLGHCLYEYIQRAQYYLHADINEELIRNQAVEFRDLMQIEGFRPNKPWINHFKAAYNITLSNRQITMTRKPPRSLDLSDIMSYCGRHTSMCRHMVNSTEVPAPAASPTTSNEAHLASARSLYRTKTLVAASSQNQATLVEVQQRRKRKINFLEKALYEYIERSQIHQKGRLDLDNLRTVAISLRDILKIENFFPDKMWFNHFKSHYNFSFSQGVTLTQRRVPLSLDLRDIVSYCGRNEHRFAAQERSIVRLPLLDPKPSPDADKAKANESGDADEQSIIHLPKLVPKTDTDKATANESCDVDEDEDEDDDCIAIEVQPELIEINDDEDEPEKATPPAKQKRLHSLDEVAPLKIQKIESIHSSTGAELDAAPGPGHYSETSNEAEARLPCVENYQDALRLLKPLEDFALMEENYRAIGLLTQLEQIFKAKT